MYEFVHYRTADYMTVDPIAVSPETTLAEAQALFEVYGFNGMPVVDGGGQLLGIITKLDILRAFILEPGHIVPPYAQIMKCPVDNCMTREPVTVTSDTPLTRVLQYLVDLGVKSLPVVDNRALAGIIAREDILEALRKATGRKT